ncbi:MAG: DUF3179 domain-containing protein [Chloroflexi bacterium]|nr:DUF3179 domain-containing protein [Chloroflexota bacterium]MBT4074132.1 DUF3179 domain-containing protein [Chloroflexota bacterium]MBT4514348.1 DUF3179 domain-containing protein [Chloroflexota bacterium]MBT5319695.1 DUF3179 domain-containing protein [Chloroflexota bacterium]MBT6682755.1 DUF3179 domain-containing protein [Chloroflexota bacterium]
MIDGDWHTFEVLGLKDGVFTMLDRQTGSVWNHLDGNAATGPLTGERMGFVPLQQMTWGEWTALYPDTRILDRSTGFESQYREVSTTAQVGVTGSFSDTRLPANSLIVGVEAWDEFHAFPFDLVAEDNGVVNANVGGLEIVVLADLTYQSGLAWSRVVDGQVLEFERISVSPFMVQDTATGSTWDIAGLSTSGPLEGTQLTWVTSFVTQWYGWAEYHPDTGLYGDPPRWATVPTPPLDGSFYRD